ncbi:hypothetical protein DB32_001995 [Sandaracinus amylolyticus]|uniref:Uncharacterized protein n=2 Tax=Sandaracinus amylolyticus TaxID=927083 RepID=A0A0F6W1I0_9BACT|nr:hypothetical protein DB32_001995 [Sandaracinus amylolyticus]
MALLAGVAGAAQIITAMCVSANPLRYVDWNRPPRFVRDVSLDGIQRVVVANGGYRDSPRASELELPNLPLQSFPIWNAIVTVVDRRLFTVRERPPRNPGRQNRPYFIPLVIRAEAVPGGVRLEAREVHPLLRVNVLLGVACAVADVVTSMVALRWCVPVPMTTLLWASMTAIPLMARAVPPRDRDAMVEEVLDVVGALIREHASRE